MAPSAHPIRSQTLVASIALVAALASSACGRSRPLVGASDPPDGGAVGDAGGPDGGGSVRPTEVQAVQVTPARVELVPGGAATLVATAVLDDGSTRDVTAEAVWSSDDEGVARVEGAGLVEALAPGGAAVSARFAGLEGVARVVVVDATVVELRVAPARATTGVGGAVAFRADAGLSDGTRLDVTSSVDWSSIDPNVATVAPDGVALGVRPGSTAVVASFDAVRGEATLEVTPAALVALEVAPVDPTVGVGVELTFTATGLYEDGARADLSAAVVWSSSAPETVAVDDDGRAATRGPGTAVVTATIGEVEGASTVTVTEAALESLVVEPAAAVIEVGGEVTLAATARYGDGTVADVTASVAWTSADPGIAAVSNARGSEGRVTGVALGTAIIRGTFGGLTATASVAVSAATLEGLSVTPASASVTAGGTVSLRATGTFSDGTARDVTGSADWSSDAPAVAAVSSATGTEGVVLGLAAGSATVTAALDGITANARITVSGGDVVGIDVAPANASTTVGLRTFYTATGRTRDGSAVDLTTSAVWSTGDPDVAVVSNAARVEGQLLAVGPGETTVSATFEGVSGSTRVVVEGADLVEVQVTPIAPRAPAGVALQFVARAVYSDGTSQNVTGRAAWSSSAPAVATIDARGRATLVAPGTSTISATFAGVIGTTSVSVTDATLVSVDVTPVSPSIAVGTTLRFQAVAIYSDGTSRNVTAMATWSSSASAVLSVGGSGFSAGLGRAVGTGTATVTATFDGTRGTQTVTVTEATLEEVQVTPSSWSTPVGSSRGFQAVAVFSDGTSRNVTGEATWRSSAASTVGVSNALGTAGRATALAAGTATVTATYDGLSDTASVTVTSATLESVQVTPFAPSVAAGLPVQFQAVALYDDGTSENVTAAATWTSSRTSVAEVSNAFGSAGRADTLTAGTTTVRATYRSVSGSTTLTVSAATIERVQVTPFLPSVPVGFGVALRATAIYTDETTRDVTALATWTSSDPDVAAVSSAFGSKGEVDALDDGMATVTASFEGVRGSTTVTVTDATLATVTVSPATASVSVRGVVAFRATGGFSDGSTLDLTTLVTWSSSDLEVADVSNALGSAGQATGFAEGTTTIRASRAGVRGTAALTVE